MMLQPVVHAPWRYATPWRARRTRVLDGCGTMAWETDITVAPAERLSIRANRPHSQEAIQTTQPHHDYDPAC